MPQLEILPDKKNVVLAPGETMLAASLRAGIPHTHACGGHARCSTCRVLVTGGLEACAPRNELEQAMAARLRFTPEVRLACQTAISGDVSVRRLALDAEDVELIQSDLGAPRVAGPVGVEKTIAILFTDIRGFTSFSEKLPAYDVMHTLNRYFDLMGKAVAKHGGCVDNYMGDGMLALFGADDAPDAPLRAVQAGLDMLAALEEFKPYLRRLYGAEFEMGIGIHVGAAILGTLGTGNRQRMTAIGDAVNYASRIEAANKKAGTRLLISAETQRAVGAAVTVKGPIEVSVAGKSGAYQLYEVVGLS